MTINDNEINETGQQFLLHLYQQVNGDPAVHVSMYDIGEALGLDRPSASRVAEELIALQLVEIKTLSGGIGISTDGVEEIRDSFGDQSAAGDKIDQLGSDPVLDKNRCQAVSQVTDDLKGKAGKLGLDFDALSELMADVKTLEAQLGSSRPKTAIIIECLRSLRDVAQTADDSDNLLKIRALLGE